MEKFRESSLKDHPEDKESIDAHCDKLAKDVVEYFKEHPESAKLQGTPDLTEVSTAVQNARRKYKRDGLFRKYNF